MGGAEQTLLRRDGSILRHAGEEISIEVDAIDISELSVRFDEERFFSDVFGGMNNDGKLRRLD